jgi:dTDP-4-amino-4,6-dideoxygalactose transaminase
MIGWNCRMDGIQGAVLGVKLRHLDTGNERRRSHAVQYNELLDGCEDVLLPFEADYAWHVYHIYAIRVRERDEVMRLLAEKGIATGVHYPIPIHLQHAYRSLGYKRGAFPVAERTAAEFISLPMFPELTLTQIELVSEELKAAVASLGTLAR